MASEALRSSEMLENAFDNREEILIRGTATAVERRRRDTIRGIFGCHFKQVPRHRPLIATGGSSKGVLMACVVVTLEMAGEMRLPC